MRCICLIQVPTFLFGMPKVCLISATIFRALDRLLGQFWMKSKIIPFSFRLFSHSLMGSPGAGSGRAHRRFRASFSIRDSTFERLFSLIWIFFWTTPGNCTGGAPEALAGVSDGPFLSLLRADFLTLVICGVRTLFFCAALPFFKRVRDIRGPSAFLGSSSFFGPCAFFSVFVGFLAVVFLGIARQTQQISTL